MSDDALRDILFIIQYGITPERGDGRADLPIEVETWLGAAQLCLDKMREEAYNKKS